MTTLPSISRESPLVLRQGADRSRGCDRMKRHPLIATVALALLCLASAATAQSAKVYRVGFLAKENYAPGSAARNFMDTVVRELRPRGYRLGSNLVIEQREAEMQYERLPALAAE